MRNSIYSRQNNECNLCKKSLGVDRLCDHILPRFLGGEDNISNYQVICTECHNWKSNSFDHFLSKLLKKNKISIDNIKKIMSKKYSEFMGLEESLDSSDSEKDSEKDSKQDSKQDSESKTEKSNFNIFSFFKFFSK